jgi:hypothetical protein
MEYMHLVMGYMHLAFPAGTTSVEVRTPSRLKVKGILEIDGLARSTMRMCKIQININ